MIISEEHFCHLRMKTALKGQTSLQRKSRLRSSESLCPLSRDDQQKSSGVCDRRYRRRWWFGDDEILISQIFVSSVTVQKIPKFQVLLDFPVNAFSPYNKMCVRHRKGRSAPFYPCKFELAVKKKQLGDRPPTVKSNTRHQSLSSPKTRLVHWMGSCKFATPFLRFSE